MNWEWLHSLRSLSQLVISLTNACGLEKTIIKTIVEASKMKRVNIAKLKNVKRIFPNIMACCPMTGNFENRRIRLIQLSRTAKRAKCCCTLEQHPVFVSAIVNTAKTITSTNSKRWKYLSKCSCIGRKNSRHLNFLRWCEYETTDRMKGRIKFRIVTRITQPDKEYAATSCAAVRTIIKWL